VVGFEAEAAKRNRENGGGSIGSVLVGRRTCDREVASSTHSRCSSIAGNLGQLSLPSLWGR